MFFVVLDSSNLYRFILTRKGLDNDDNDTSLKANCKILCIVVFKIMHQHNTSELSNLSWVHKDLMVHKDFED